MQLGRHVARPNHLGLFIGESPLHPHHAMMALPSTGDATNLKFKPTFCPGIPVITPDIATACEQRVLYGDLAQKGRAAMQVALRVSSPD
jgi:hypothetical protein